MTRAVSTGAEAVRRFIDAFNDEDLDALAAVLDPHVLLQTRAGAVIGREEARRWATRTPTGELWQALVIDDLRERGNHVLALLRRQWSWREGNEVADEEQFGVVADLRDGLIGRWQPFDDRAEASRVFDELTARS